MKAYRRPSVFLARLLWVGLGAGVAITIALTVTTMGANPLLLASLGGSTLFLFGLTKLPAAQPRSLFGGHLIAAAMGIACFKLFGVTTLAYALSVSFTIMLLLLLRSVHPPAAANALLMVKEEAGWFALFDTVFLGVLCLAVTASLWSRLIPGSVTYPVRWLVPSPRAHRWSIWG